MIPFVLLVTVSLVARLVGFGGVDALDGWQRLYVWGWPRCCC